MSRTLADWVGYVFDRPVEDPAWHWSLDAPYWELAPTRAAELIAETFERAGQLLPAFSDAQLNQGLWFVLSNGCSDYMFCASDETVAWPLRKRLLWSFVPLFRDVMAIRCTPVLSHLDEPGATPLNSACYMCWDLIPIGSAPEAPGAVVLHEEIVLVLGELLRIPHDACRESALHGLGHWSMFTPKAGAVIEQFLHGSQSLRPELLAYARSARTGCIL
jgi:hypothetical protein